MIKQENLFKKTPNSIDLEKILLGYLLVDGVRYKQIREMISPRDFALPHHVILFQTFEDLFLKNGSFQENLLLDYLKGNDLLEKAGGEFYLLQLKENFAPSKGQYVFHALDACVKQIKIKSVRRKIQMLGQRLLSKVIEDTIQTDNELDQIIKDLVNVNNKSIDCPYKHISQVSEEFLLSLTDAKYKGVPTGYSQLDLHIDGFHKKQLITIAAETSMGKTTFAWNIAFNMAAVKIPVAYLSLEMSEMEMQSKAYSILCGLSYIQMRNLDIQSEEMQIIKYHNAVTFKKIPIYITEKTLNIFEIKRTTRLLKEQFNIQVIFLDHLHFMQSEKDTETRNLAIAAITSELKALAKELDITVVMLSQLNRAGSLRASRRPILTDLRDSGAIEQDSDIVLFLYRPGVHNDINEEQHDLSYTEIIIAKNRNGQRNVSIELHFNQDIGMFNDPSFVEENQVLQEQRQAIKRSNYYEKD